jgi:tetratricopeptide (TPR) repeat protein
LIEDAIAATKGGRTPNRLSESVAQGAAEALYGIGVEIGLRDGGFHLAVANLRLAIDLAPQHAHALLWLGTLLRQRKMFREALSVFERVPADSPLKRSAEIQAAVTLANLDPTEARRQLDQLISENPRDLDGITALGNLLRSRKQYAECAEVYGRGIATLDKPVLINWTIFYFRGICLERQNLWDQAERDLERARALNPDNPQLLNYLGFSLIDRGLRTDEALRMIQRAVAQRPNDGHMVDSLGWAYFKLGRFDEALVQLTQAGKLLPKAPEVADHLGDVLWVLGRQGEARAAWQRALSLSPEPELARQIEAKLKSGL